MINADKDVRNAVHSRDKVVNSALDYMGKKVENAWFCKDEEVLYKGRPAVVRQLGQGEYIIEQDGKRIKAKGRELSAPWTNSKVKNDYPMAAAKDKTATNGDGPNGWDKRQCALALAGATDEQVKIAAADGRNALLQKCAREEARKRKILINADTACDAGKCSTCEFGNFGNHRMQCRRGYDPKITNGACKFWKGDSMTRAVNMSTQQAITSVEMLLGSEDPLDKDEALEILRHHRYDIERDAGPRQYAELYRRASNSKKA